MTNNGNNDFERKIKSSLEGYEVPFVQADWNEMEGKLNTLPKPSASFNLPNFKWNFSMNVFVAIIACTGVFFLIYKLSNSDSTKSEQVNPPSPKATPVMTTTTLKAPGVPQAKNNKPVEHQPAVAAADPSGNDTTLFMPVAAEVPVVNENRSNTTVIPAPVKRSAGGEDKSVSHMEPVQATLGGQDQQKVLFYDDMLDPKKGFIYPTKDKAVEASAPGQTNVNLGWNDYVIYDPKKADSVKGAHVIPSENKAVPAESPALKNKSEKKQKNSKKDKIQPKPDSAPDAGTKEMKKDSSGKGASEPAKTDTTTIKRSHKANKNPKFTNDKSMLDPY